MNNNPYTSDKLFNSDDENLQLQTFHETYPSVTKKSLNKTFYGPSFFNHTSKINDVYLFSDAPLDRDTKLNYKRRDPVLKVVYHWITEKIAPVNKNTDFYCQYNLDERL